MQYDVYVLGNLMKDVLCILGACSDKVCILCGYVRATRGTCDVMKVQIAGNIGIIARIVIIANNYVR